MWVVVNIGCIECGVSSAIVGVFPDKDRAEKIASFLDKRLPWRRGGENSFEVFELPQPGVIADEYREVLPDEYREVLPNAEPGSIQ
jgi:hypothetical protein